MIEAQRSMDQSLEWVERNGGGGVRLPQGSGGGGENPGTPPPPPPPPPKKNRAPPALKKQTQTKIQACNSKLTDIKCWSLKVEASPL